MSAGRDIYAEQHSAFAVEEHLSGKPVRWGRWSLIVRRRNVLIWCLLLTLALSMAWLGLLQGTTKTDAGQVWAALTRPDDSSLTTIVWDLRLPRVVLGLLVGASLAASGAVFQSMSRNALGSPDIIGFLSGAAAGAVTAIIVFDAGPLAVAASAAGAGLLTAVLVLGLAHRGGSLGGERLVLVGVGVGALMQAVTTVLLTKTDPEVAIAGRIWLTGTLNARTWAEAAMPATGLLSCLPILILASRRLAALEMGDEMSMQGGVPVRSTRIVVGMAGTGLVALATAAPGRSPSSPWLHPT